jgi:hypothetical protein
MGLDVSRGVTHPVVMEVLLAIVLVALVLAAVVALVRRPVAPSPRRSAWSAPDPTGARVVLDLDAADPEHPSVRRLVDEAGRRALARDRSLERVVVEARDGRPLGEVERPRPLPPSATLPDSLEVSHGTRPSPPSPVGHDEVDGPRRPPEPAPEVVALPLADRLDLPPSVRARVADPDRATDVVVAILAEAGSAATVDGDLIRVGDVALVIVDPRRDPERALTYGFLRIQGTDAARGIVLRLGYVDPQLVRAREAAAPHVRHVGPDGLQRMADAVTAGARDPLAFLLGPATVV